jgi:hypothetical protein
MKLKKSALTLVVILFCVSIAGVGLSMVDWPCLFDGVHLCSYYKVADEMSQSVPKDHVEADKLFTKLMGYCSRMDDGSKKDECFFMIAQHFLGEKGKEACEKIKTNPYAKSCASF